MKLRLAFYALLLIVNVFHAVPAAPATQLQQRLMLPQDTSQFTYDFIYQPRGVAQDGLGNVYAVGDCENALRDSHNRLLHISFSLELLRRFYFGKIVSIEHELNGCRKNTLPTEFVLPCRRREDSDSRKETEGVFFGQEISKTIFGLRWPMLPHNLR